MMLRFIKNEKGATAIEYGFIVALVSIGIVLGALAIGGNLTTVYGGVNTDLQEVIDQ